MSWYPLPGHYEMKKPPGWEAFSKNLAMCAQSDLLPTTTSSSIIRSSISTRLITMVSGSNVEFTDRLPFLLLYTNYHTTLLFICQYPSQNFKVRQSQSREITSRLHLLCYSTTSICSGSSTMISGAPWYSWTRPFTRTFLSRNRSSGGSGNFGQSSGKMTTLKVFL